MIKSFLPNQEQNEYSDELKEELDKRYEDIVSGSAKLVTPEESKKRIDNILNGI